MPETPGVPSRDAGAFSRFRALLPQGLALPPSIWHRRHRTVVAVVLAHAPLLAAFGSYRGWPWPYVVAEPLLIVALGLLATWRAPSTRFRSAMAALAGVTCSAILVQFSGGYIEAHFHFFIMVALMAVYQDWLPFLVAVAYVALDHGVLGQVAPDWVYNHDDAVANPWGWAAVHAVMVLGQCAALLLLWRGVERERARSDVILHSAGDGILGLNRDGTVQFANPAAARILGVRDQDLQDQPFVSLLGGAATAWPPAPGPHEVSVRRDGAERPIAWVAQPAPATEVGVEWVIVVHDLAERRRQERERLEHLLEQDRFKTQLLNTASHELNTPISVVRLQLDLLRRELPPGARSRPLELLERNVGRLSKLVEQTLDVARIEGGRLKLERGPVQMGALLVDACRSFEQKAAAKGVRFRWRVEEGLEVDADGTRLSQVFYNLVANAVKFTPSGGSIEATARRTADGVVVRVADTGIGLAADDIGLLFKPFSQGRNNSAPGGTGLGLYICRNIVEAHGGTILADSEGLGKGAAFTCVIPAAPAVVAFRERAQEPAPLAGIKATS